MNGTPLSFLDEGSCGRITEILGGHGLRNRLYELGLVKGSKVKLITRNSGPLIVAVGDTRLALGRGMAQKVLVAVEEPDGVQS